MYVVAVGATFLSLTVLFVSLRICTRLVFIRTLGWDDFFLVLSMLTNIVFFVLTIIQVHNGLGKHESTLSPKTIQNQLKALWITIPMYNLTMNLTKVSMGILYFRAFKTKTYQRVLIAYLVFVIITGLWMVLSTLFFCTPIRGFWDKSIHSYCMPQIVIWCLNASLQIATDLLTVILPMPALAKLHLALRQRFALIVIFALGLFVVVTSAIRLSQLIEYIRGTDPTEEGSSATSWSFIESSVAIISASLPPLRPLIARLFPIPVPSTEEQPETQIQPGTQSNTNTTSKPDSQPLTIDPAYSFTNTNNTSYSASVTGTCPENNPNPNPNPNFNHTHNNNRNSNSNDTNNTNITSPNTTTTITNDLNSEDLSRCRSSSIRQRQPSHGIQVVKHICWDSDSANSNDRAPRLGAGRQLQLEPYPGDSLSESLPRSYQLPEIEP